MKFSGSIPLRKIQEELIDNIRIGDYRVIYQVDLENKIIVFITYDTEKIFTVSSLDNELITVIRPPVVKSTKARTRESGKV